MKLSASNIGFKADDETEIYTYLATAGFSGLEIAPTRIFPDNPYDHCESFVAFSKELFNKHGLEICSLQSIWYGKKEKIFGDISERQILIDYTKKALEFASLGGCRNLVLGCPKNRARPEGASMDIALEFFSKLGELATQYGCVIALEPNPEIYGTNFLNTTAEAVDFIRTVNSNGITLNIDLGTMIHGNESVSVVKTNLDIISHIHLSEPYLAPLKHRDMHRVLSTINYDKYFSIEMAAGDDTTQFCESVEYVRRVFA